MKDRTPELLISYEREALQDACGIVGILSSNDDLLFEEGLAAIEKLQTRGYDGAGFVALRTDGAILMHKGEGTVSEVFKPEIVNLIQKNAFYSGFYQVRYGTSGEFSPENVQPFVSRHKASQDMFVLTHNGQFSKDTSYDYRSDTVQFVEKLANTRGANWDERIKNALVNQSGAWSLIIGTENSIYLARDCRGIRPLYFAQKMDNQGGFVSMAASETVALERVGFQNIMEVLPGQIVKFERNKSGFQTTDISKNCEAANCIFENVYTMDENGRAFIPRKTQIEVQNSPLISDIRDKCGAILAQEAPLTNHDVDIVIGIPGTGITGGEAYARELGLSYVQAIKDKDTPGSEQRTFMQAHVEGILKKVMNHFNFDTRALVGKRVVLVDDSLVRGNISEGLVKILKEHMGVLSVHFRILSPPIDKPCFLGINTRSKSELIAANFAKNNASYKVIVENVRKKIGADSLAYLSNEGLLEAVSGDPHATGFCMGCMLHKHHPIDQFGNIVENDLISIY